MSAAVEDASKPTTFSTTTILGCTCGQMEIWAAKRHIGTGATPKGRFRGIEWMQERLVVTTL